MNYSYGPLANISFKDEFELEDLERFQEEGITANPHDYYFAIEKNHASYGDVEFELQVIITPKKLWDEEGCWSDSGYTIPILKDQGHLDGYYDLMESIAEPPCDWDEGQIRNDLLSKGFVENKNLISDPSPVNPVDLSSHPLAIENPNNFEMPW